MDVLGVGFLCCVEYVVDEWYWFDGCVEDEVVEYLCECCLWYVEYGGFDEDVCC